MKKINVASFATDHLTLDAGLYLRDTIRVGLFSKILQWDCRIYAPHDHIYLTPGAAHVIEHMMAYHLREQLGSDYVQVFIYGCFTGFSVMTRSSVTLPQLRQAIVNVIDEVCPILAAAEVPCLTPLECGRPTLFDLKGATTALLDYRLTLTSPDGYPYSVSHAERV